MSIPKQKLHELIDLLPDEKTGEILNIVQNYIETAPVSKPAPDWDPEEFVGILDNLNINVEEECKKMRGEWDHRGWDVLSD